MQIACALRMVDNDASESLDRKGDLLINLDAGMPEVIGSLQQAKWVPIRKRGVPERGTMVVCMDATGAARQVREACTAGTGETWKGEEKRIRWEGIVHTGVAFMHGKC